MKQYDMMTIDAGMEPPDPQDAEYSWDTEEIRDFHRAMEVCGGHTRSARPDALGQPCCACCCPTLHH